MCVIVCKVSVCVVHVKACVGACVYTIKCVLVCTINIVFGWRNTVTHRNALPREPSTANRGTSWNISQNAQFK